MQQPVEAGVEGVEEARIDARYIAHSANVAFEGGDDGEQARGEGRGF